jgi:branched-chain amino acid transport system ATP-binding protein
MTSTPTLSVDHLTAVLGGRNALESVEMHVNPGEVVAIFGHNGGGKSTLLRCIMGAIPFQFGRIQLGFTNWRRDPHALAKAGVSYLPQRDKLFSNLTVWENLLVYSDAIGLDRFDFDRNYQQLSQQFPILQDAKTVVSGKLSGGEIQQVAIARAFLASARLLLLDEPTIGLAPQMRKRVFAMIREFVAQPGRSIIVVEHRIQETLMFAQRAYVLRQGKVVMSGEAAELSEKMSDLQVAIM